MPPKAAGDDFLGRFREIVSDPVNLLIRRSQRAGLVENDLVYLHNDLKVPLSGPHAYYGAFSSILVINRGVHEPLEEFVFQELVSRLPGAPVMIELGAYWGHYSMWLKSARPAGAVYLVEPEPMHLQAGVQNFGLNGLTGEFIQAMVGTGHFEVDAFLAMRAVEKLDVLHCDIQGAELEMLQGCLGSLADKSIDYLFISTHSQALHDQSVALLEEHGYRVEVSSDFDHGTTSYDGFIFASSPSAKPILEGFVPIDRVDIPSMEPADIGNYLSDVARRRFTPSG